MRLRRETGDFKIVVSVKNSTVTVNSIRPGLAAEDLIGEVVDANGVLEAVVSAEDASTTVTAITASYTLTYTKATGAITGVANG